MGYSANKATRLRPVREKWLSTFVYALLTATAFFLPFIIWDKGYFIFYGDFNAQQIPFYQMCHSAVRNGQFGWNWLTDLGSDFIGSYSYYLLGSPFFWLTIPFPNWTVPYLMGPLLILKFAFSALTAYFYIRRFTKTPEAARLGGLLYAFSSFSIYNIFFNQFHEAIVFFPLLLLSLEWLITENRKGPFALFVFICAGVNYYFFFGMVVFTIIYLIVRAATGAVKLSFGKFMLVALESVIGFAMSAFIMLPSAISVLAMPRSTNFLLGWAAMLYKRVQIYPQIITSLFFPPDIPARPVFYPDLGVKWSSIAAWLPLFAMVGVFAFIKGKNKNWIKTLLIICGVMSFIPILNNAFYAFNSAYYARWFYMPILIMSLATVMAVEDRDVSFKSSYFGVGAFTAVVTLVLGFFPQEVDGKLVFGLYTQTAPLYRMRYFITCGIAIISLIVLGLVLLKFKKRDKAFLRTCTALVCVITVAYSGFFIYSGKQHSDDVQSVVIDMEIEGKVDLPDDPDTYRIDTYKCPDNIGMYLGYNSMNAFHSVVSGSIIDFYNFVGENRTVASRIDIDNYAIRNLLSVKYILVKADKDDFMGDDGISKIPTYSYYGSQDGYNVYENINYIPYGFSYNCYISESDCEKIDKKHRDDIMLKAIVLSDEQIKKYGDTMSPLDTTVTYQFDEKELVEDCEYLAATSATEFDINNNGFTATVDRKYDSLVFFSVPYDSGWTATVNGKPVEIEKVNKGFMAVPVSNGTSNIVFTYKTHGLELGLMISGGAAAVYVIYILICFMLRRRKRTPVYPEGDMLISRWEQYEKDDFAEQNDELPAEDETLSFSLDRIAEQLQKKYPSDNFQNGFTVNTDILDDKEDNS